MTFKDMSDEALSEHIQKLAGERVRIQQEIQAVNLKREQFLKEARKDRTVIVRSIASLQ